MYELLADKIGESPLKPDSLVDRVTRLLEEGIINMTFPPGSSLVEETLAKTLDISRSPVREALLRLEEEGLVKKARKGRIIASLNKQSVMEYYEVWEMTHTFSAAKACLEANKEDYEKLEEVLKEMKSLASMDSTDIMTRYHHLNSRFHLTLVAPCSNPHLVRMHSTALKHIQWCWNLSIHHSRDLIVSYSEHQNIYEAFRSRDMKLLEGLVKAHVREASQRFLVEYSKKRRE